MSAWTGPAVVTVGELVAHLKRLVEGDPWLARVWVRGELSGVKQHASGHWYFVLKDSAQIRAVMFRRDALRLRFRPADGQQVLAFGRVGVYERDGQTQLYVEHLEPVGVGQYFLELEALKARLQAEGLFSRPKRALPRLPRAVGVVTSPSGAAWQDVRTVAHRRFPGMRLVMAPVTVQGPGAPEAIVAGLRRLADYPTVDVVIVTRGGGSREDLAVFNDERVVREIARMPVPVVSAVGHEVDVTLADLAADLRAPTPSAAAELAVPERHALARTIAELEGRAQRQLRHRLSAERWRVERLARHGVLAGPAALLTSRRMAASQLGERLDLLLREEIRERRRALARLDGQLGGLNPLAVMARGFGLVTDAAGHTVTAATVSARDLLTVEWFDGAWETEARAPVPSRMAVGDGSPGRV
jgi:exodeoxyribonuclease VII large subunit